MRFIEYLILEQEVNVTVSGEDPAGSMAKAKDIVRKAGRSPQQAIKQRQANLRDREQEIAKEEDPEIRGAEEDILRDEERIAKRRQALETDRDRKEKEKARRVGTV